MSNKLAVLCGITISLLTAGNFGSAHGMEVDRDEWNTSFVASENANLQRILPYIHMLNAVPDSGLSWDYASELMFHCCDVLFGGKFVEEAILDNFAARVLSHVNNDKLVCINNVLTRHFDGGMADGLRHKFYYIGHCEYIRCRFLQSVLGRVRQTLLES